MKVGKSIDTEKLFFEFIVIIMGVLTALAIQTIVQSHSDNIEKRKYLQAIREELADNIAHIDSMMMMRRHQEDSTKLLTQLLSEKTRDEITITKHMERFFELLETKCKLGSYEALKNSNVFDKVESIELITRLNNLDAQIDLTLAWQMRIQNISFEFFVSGNNGAINLANYRPQLEKVFSAEYIDKITYLSYMRMGLTHEFVKVSTEMKNVERLVELEMR